MCYEHSRPLELYCDVCKTYICPVCLSDHYSACPTPKFKHVFRHASDVSLPKLDKLIKDSDTIGPEHNDESVLLLTSLYNVISPLKHLTEEHNEFMDKLKKSTKEIESLHKYLEGRRATNSSREQELLSCQRNLTAALTSKNLIGAVKFTLQAFVMNPEKKKMEEEKAAVEKVRETVRIEGEVKKLRELAESVKAVLLKCQSLRLNFSVFNWRCDPNYLSPKIGLSEDGLEIKCVKGTGYAAIIGDTPIDYGIMVFEVTASGLCCSGKEGFGIIEYSKYKELFAANPETPTAYDSMTGLMHGDIVKNMLVLTGNELLLDVPFTVSINMCDHVLNIKGPGTLLTTELKTGVQYVPCFSLGCEKNKFVVHPLEAMIDEADFFSS